MMVWLGSSREWEMVAIHHFCKSLFVPRSRGVGSKHGEIVLQLLKVGWLEVLACGSGTFYRPSLLKRFGKVHEFTHVFCTLAQYFLSLVV
jgi:hypothetical protein